MPPFATIAPKWWLRGMLTSLFTLPVNITANDLRSNRPASLHPTEQRRIVTLEEFKSAKKLVSYFISSSRLPFPFRRGRSFASTRE